MKKLLFIRFTCQSDLFRPVMISISAIFKKLVLVLILVWATENLYSQNVAELNGFLEQIKVSDDPVVSTDAKHLDSLVNGIKSTVYVGGEIISNNETLPVCANVKSGALAKLIQNNPMFRQVELLTIKLTNPADLTIMLDIPALIGFQNLKYVYFICEFNCGIEDIRKLFLPQTGIAVFYKISIPS